MAFGINGTDFLQTPSVDKWVSKPVLDVTGKGNPVYPSVMEYELKWDIIDSASLDQLFDFYDTGVASGTVIVSLPEWKSSTYQFKNYTGCVIYEPEVGDYFVEYVTDVRLLIANIRV